MIINVKRKSNCEDIPIPEYHSEGASGMDLRAAVDKAETLEPGKFKMIPTGLSISIPKGFEAQVRARSGLAFKHGIGVLNAPGTIDSDYRGEIGVILFNFNKQSFTINRGDRIAQLIVTRYQHVVLNEVENLDESTRNSGGFGSTGHS